MWRTGRLRSSCKGSIPLVWSGGLVASRALLSAFLILLFWTFRPFFAMAARNRNSVVLLTIIEFR